MVLVDMDIHTVARPKVKMNTDMDMDIHMVARPKVIMDTDTAMVTAMVIRTMRLRFPCLMVLMACKRADMPMPMLLPNTM